MSNSSLPPISHRPLTLGGAPRDAERPASPALNMGDLDMNSLELNLDGDEEEVSPMKGGQFGISAERSSLLLSSSSSYIADPELTSEREEGIGGGMGDRETETLSPPPLWQGNRELREFEFDPVPLEFLSEGEEDFDQEVSGVSPFEAYCEWCNVQESDLGPLRQRLTRYDDAVALYNDFEGYVRQVENVKAVFEEVFTKLQHGNNLLEGELQGFFKNHIGRLHQLYLINQWEASELYQLALPEALRKSRGQKALEDKGWLVAAMVLGLMASYPLILKPACQAGGDLLRRMRGISVPKVQG